MATIRSAQAKLLDRLAGVGGQSPAHLGHRKGRELEWKQGGPEVLRNLRDDQAVISDSFASDHGLEVGDAFQLLSQTRKRRASKWSAPSSKLDVLGSVLITQAAMARDFGQTQDTIDFVETEAGSRRGRRCRQFLTVGSKPPSRSRKC